MGRPLNKKYFGKRNPGAAGTFGNTNLLPTDYDLGGTRVTGGTVGTAGSFASTTLSSPVIAASGAITFSTTTTALPAGTPIAVTGTNSGGGTITNATYYVAATPAPTATGVTLVTTSGGSTVATTTAGTPTGLSFTYTQFASYTFPAPVLQSEGAVTAVGAPIYSIVSATVAAGGSGYANSATAFTVGNATLTITPSGNALTGTVTVTTAGTFTAPLAAGPQAVVGGTGTGGTVTITYGLVSGGTMSNQGNGYLSNTVGTTYVKATTGTASVSSVTSTIAASSGILTVTAVTGTIANGMILTGGSVTAGAYIQYQLTSTASAVVSPTFSSGGAVGTNTITLSAGTSVAVGQIVTGTGLSAGTTVTAISGANATLSNYFTQQAAGTYNFYAYGGNGTYQLGLNNASGLPATATTVTGTPTAGSVDLVTVTSTADMSIGMRFTPARTFGNLTGGTTYFVLAILSSTTFTVGGTVGATSATAQATTAAPTLSSPVIAASGAITFTSITTALAAGTPVVVSGTNSGAGSITNGTYYVAASPAASATGMTLVTSPNGTTVATTTAGTPTGLTFTFYPAAPFGQNNTVTVGGTGTSSPAATITLQTQVTTGYVGMYPAIQAVAVTVGQTARSESDIIKQENSQRFRVENQDGVAYCKLITSYPTSPGTMAIQATDSTGNLYWATRITNRQCVVTRQSGNTTGQFVTGQRVNWVFGTAVLNTSVKLDNA